MKQLSQTRPKANLPAEEQKLLNDALFADSASMNAGGVITAVLAAICWLITDALTPLLFAVAATLIAAIRFHIAQKRRTSFHHLRDEVYKASLVAYLFISGMLTFWAFVYNQSEFILAITLIVSIINTMGIALRSFAMGRKIIVLLLAIVTPVVAGFVLRGGYFYIAALTQLILAAHVYTSAHRLRAILLSEMTYRRRSDTIAARFRLAIDNMSHGICMIDDEMRIVVSNGKLAECFGLPEKRPLQGTRFDALVRLGRLRKTLTSQQSERLMASFDAPEIEHGVAGFEMTGASGRSYELALRPNDEGGWVLVVQDVTAQRRAREALDLAARFDAMTQLPNRRSFEERVVEVLKSARGTEMRTEVLFLDLDGFKQINDTLGHKFGDRVLAESASRLREMIGDSAYASRWGGDEFVILRTGIDDEATMAFAAEIIAKLSHPMWIEGAEVAVGASVGVAICVGGAIGMDALLSQADMALYTAKRENRGSCRLYELAMSDRLQERRLLELDLQAALAARTFELHYQPIVDIETLELVSFEALARWRHPTRGVVSPALFVPVLEELNLMNSFGAWALQRACEDAARWPRPVRVGVNVSTRQIETLVESVNRALASSGLEPHRLELEITETAALASGDLVRRSLETVRARGVRVALDDFGTGYSSLSHLLQLPLDKVKIDKSFVQQLGENRTADVVVANIARLSSQLGMRVTFEGVETNEQLERARALGVAAEGQGWLFGRPMSATDLKRVFEREDKRAVA